MASTSSWVHHKAFSFWFHERTPDFKVAWYAAPWKNRYVRLFFIEFGIVASTALVFSWQPFSSMLFGSNVYSWLCSAEAIALHEEAVLNNPGARYGKICSEQNDAIQILYSLYNAAEFLFGAVAGVCFDYLGPFLTGCIGQTLLGLGCITFIVSSESLPLYIPAILLLGGSCNFNVFPALAVPDYFPKHGGLIISLTIACQNGGAFVTTVLDQIFRNVPALTLQVLFLFYVTCFLVPVGIFYLLSLPLVRFALHPLYQRPAVDDQQQQSHEMWESLVVEKGSKAPPVVSEAPCSSTPGQEKLLPSSKQDDGCIDTSSSSNPGNNNSGSIIVLNESSGRTPSNKPQTSFITKPTVFRRGRDDLITPEFIAFSVLTFLSTLQYNYYPVVLRDLSGDAIARFNGTVMLLALLTALFTGYVFPTQALWGVIYGVVVDYTTTLPIAYFLVALITAVYAFCLIPSYSLQYVTTILYVLGTTYIYSIKFTYVAETFSPRNNGVLMGVLSIVSGVTMVINILLVKLDNTRAVLIGVLTSVVLSFALVGWLDHQRRKGVSYKHPVTGTAESSTARTSTADIIATTTSYESPRHAAGVPTTAGSAIKVQSHVS